MDAVTYPDDLVQQELAQHWLTAKLDVAQQTEVADVCGITAIPTALAIDTDGRVLGSILGFMAPGDFRQQLTVLRAEQ